MLSMRFSHGSLRGMESSSDGWNLSWITHDTEVVRNDFEHLLTRVYWVWQMLCIDLCTLYLTLSAFVPDFRCCCCQSRPEFIASLLWPILFSISRQGDSTRRAQSHALPGPSSSRPIFLHLASPSLPQPCRVQLVSTPSKLNFPTARSMILQTYKAKQSWLSMLRPSGRVVFKEALEILRLIDWFRIRSPTHPQRVYSSVSRTPSLVWQVPEQGAGHSGFPY